MKDSPVSQEKEGSLLLTVPKPEQKSELIKALPRLDETDINENNQSKVIYVLPEVAASMKDDSDPWAVVEMAKIFDKK